MLRKPGSHPRQNGLARAVFLNRLGEIRDRSFENQRYRASGLKLVVAAIVLWNTDYVWRQSKQVEQGNFRPLQMLGEAWRTIFPVSRADPKMTDLAVMRRVLGGVAEQRDAGGGADCPIVEVLTGE